MGWVWCPRYGLNIKTNESGLIISVLSVCTWNSVMLWQKSHALTRISRHFWSLPASRAMSQTVFYCLKFPQFVIFCYSTSKQMRSLDDPYLVQWCVSLEDWLSWNMLISILNPSTQWTILAVTGRTFCACPKIINCQIYTSKSGWVSLLYGFVDYEPVICGAESNIDDDFGLGVVGLCFPFLVRHQGHFIKAIICSEQ